MHGARLQVIDHRRAKIAGLRLGAGASLDYQVPILVRVGSLVFTCACHTGLRVGPNTTAWQGDCMSVYSRGQMMAMPPRFHIIVY